MSNNLRQIAKDLRSFVKRCKDVHYSDSLLISFLITGLLTIAPKLHADVASEQQEITAQTYDAITDLRQSFMRARKENEKSLKGAQSELVQLLKQGDQVIKSPWASFQFGTGFTNNDWGTTYRGRGGKYLEYYRRDNDLTKYVFDKDKHLYGATNLNIPRNQEPDALTINPANMHEPYKPYVPERMNNVSMIEKPEFNPDFEAPLKVNPYKAPSNTYGITRSASSANSNNILGNHYIEPGSNFNDDIDDTVSTDGTHFVTPATSITTSTSNTSPDGTFTTSTGAYHNERWWADQGGTLGAITDISGNFVNGITSNDTWYSNWYNSYYANYTGVNAKNGATSLLSSYSGYDNMYGGYSYWNYSRAYYSAYQARLSSLITYYNSRYLTTYTANSIPTGETQTIEELARNTITWNGSGYTYDVLTWIASSVPPVANSGTTTTTSNTNSTLYAGSNYRAASILADSDVTIHDADFRVGNAGGLSDSSRNAIIVTGSSTTATVRDSDFTVTNDNNNAIRVDDGKLVIGSSNVAPTLNSNYAGSSGSKATSTEINLQGNNNNGIIVKAGKAELTRVVMNTGIGRFNNGVVNNGGATADTVTDTNSAITIGGTDSNGFYQKGAGSSTLNGTQIIVNGTNNNGIRVSDGTLNTNLSGRAAGGLTRGNITVGGTNNNGIFLDDSTNDITANIAQTNISVNSTTGIGLLVGNHEKVNSNAAANKNVKLNVSYTEINASGTDGVADSNGAGVYIYNTGSTGYAKFNEATRIKGNGKDVLMNINNYNFDSLTAGSPVTNKVEFHGGTTSPAIGGGYTSAMETSGDQNIGINIANGHNKRPTETSIKGELNTSFIGNHNIGILNNYYADKLDINLGLSGTNNVKPASISENGVMTADGDHNIMFANLGYIKDGSFNIDALDMHGKGSIGVYLKGNSNPNHLLDTDRNNIGMITPELKVQGVLGATDGHSSANSNDTPNSVGIYAVSGQRKEISQNVIGYVAGGTTTVGDLIADVNIGLNENADNSVVLWAGEGTVINAKNSRYAANVTQNGAITDGIMLTTGGAKWGYDVHDDVVSTGSVIGYATGYLDPGKQGLHNYGSLGNLASKIKFDNNVDMVAKEGTAYLANGGAEIEALSTRAGGIKSVIAYATGEHGINGGGSSITVNGNIIAADNNLLGSINNTNGVPKSYTIASDLSKTYGNVAGVAINGGQVTFKGTSKEQQVTESVAADQNKAATKSLVYGMAAYAIGQNTAKTNPSKVKFETPITVISGENGALYATDNGEIEFQGDIINQNNIGPTLTTKAGATGVAAGTRNGRGNVGSANNDHKYTAPFYVKRTTEGNTSVDKSGILFNGATAIDIYDGILLTGNQYNVYNLGGAATGQNIIRDYIADDSRTSSNAEAYDMAKYRGMKNVTAKIMENKSVDLGVINQIEDGQTLVWNTEGNTNSTSPATGTANYLDSIGKYYAGGMAIKNDKWSGLSPAITPNKTADNTEVGNRFDSTILNSALTIKNGTTVNVEDVETTGTVAAANKINDPFNDIKMESTLVTIENGATVKGDAANRIVKDIYNGKNYQVLNAGLSMGNSLYRWKTTTIGSGAAAKTDWIKTKNTQSGFVNKGTVDITGGSQYNNLAALNVAFGTVENIGAGGSNKAEIKLDHGYGIFATDGSIVNASGTTTNDSTITVTGKYQIPSQAPTGGSNRTTSAENDPTGSNYGIVGISKGRVSYNVDDAGNLINSIDITSTNTTIKVDGGDSLNGAATATGIFAENNEADKDKVTVKYDDSALNSAGIELQNNGSSASSRGVGIALVNRYANGNGGEITLTGRAGTLGSNAATGNNIFTKENGIGIYAENSDIKLTSDDFTITTNDDGVGIWTTDASNVGKGSALHSKTFNYNYNGKTDKKGFAMAFTGRTGQTNATNYLDIKFNNKGTTTDTKLADEIAKSTSQGTYKGIAGIVVNTNDALDTVTNYGDIKEEGSKTHVRTYGAVVNKGTFRNFGDITLNESLSENANNITSEDMKKANIGIFANDLNDKEGGKNTYIENYADIKIGDMTAGNSDKNIGSWAIYGYNIKTGKKSDGTQQTIDIARNNYGIYSGDGTVDIRGTKINVGNDTVLGHKMNTWTDSNGTVHNIDRQNGQYSQAQDLLSKLDTPRERDSAIGVYIDSNESRSGDNRNVRIDADMDIDRFSNGIVIAENNSLKNPITTVTIGDSNTSPNILLGSNKVTGGPVLSTKPTNPRVPDEIYEQGNSVYYYSADKNSNATSWANVKMNGDYNTAYYTEGSVENHGNIDLRSQNNLNLPSSNAASAYHGYGNVGIASANVDAPSVNYGTITTGMSDTENLQYSIGMGAGRNIYVDKTTATGKERVYDRTEKQGHVVNKGKIVVQEDDGIGMFATGSRSRAENWGTIELVGNNAIGMYLDRGAIGENHGTITGNANNLKGVLAINGGYIKNYGTIKVEGSGSNGIVTDDVKVKTDNTDGSGDLYGGTENSIKLATTGNPKTTGVGTTITMPSIVPITKISVDGVDTPIFNVETDAANIGDIANNITVKSSIQTGGTRIIDLKAIDEWGNPVWPQRDKPQLSEVTSVGMYVDTSGVRYTNPVDGLQNLPKLGEVNLYFGPEATLYTNAKAIRIGDTVDANGTVTKSNMLKPFNDALAKLPGGAIVNPLSASLTWQVAAKLDANNQLSEIYMSKVPYHSFAYDNDKSLVNFTNNLDNIYEIARPQSAEKIIFNKLNSLGNGEGHILAQAFDQMRGHIYGGVQQRIKSTSDILTGEMNGLRSDRNVSKDSNKFKAFGQRNEFKTDTAGMPDWYSNAGGFAFVHEDETVRLGQSSGWSAGVVNNYFTFKDLSKSYENQAMAKVGVFKTIPLDANGTFVLSLGGDGFFGRNDMKRRFWVVDQEFRAKASYYSYGAGLNAGLEKAFVINDGFSIVPNVGIRAEYGRFSSIHENGDMALNVKSDDYVSVKPSAGIDFRYSQEVFKNSNLTASLGFAYENEIGKLYDIENEARIVGAWTDYFGIRGDKEDKRGNFKSDLKLGLDNGRFGFNVNTGYDSKGHNFRAGLGLKVLY